MNSLDGLLPSPGASAVVSYEVELVEDGSYLGEREKDFPPMERRILR